MEEAAVLQEIAWLHQQVRSNLAHTHTLLPCARPSQSIQTPPTPNSTPRMHPCQVRDLLAAELFGSAEILGGLVLARSRAHSPDGFGPHSASSIGSSSSSHQRQQAPPSLGSHAESVELYGDALMGRGEIRRALVRLLGVIGDDRWAFQLVGS